MTKLHGLAIVAGLLFGAWPLLMNRSGLNGPLSAAAFAFFCFITVLPAALYSYNANVVAAASWKIALVAGLVAGLGLLMFSSILAKVTPQTVGTYFVIMILAQISVPAINHTLVTGEYSMKRLAGFGVAALAVFLLK